jgi:signal transduction histidine kinase
MSQFLLRSEIRTERDIVWARKKARELAEFLKIDNQEQIRLATAVSELARNAYQYAGGGFANFSIIEADGKIFIQIAVVDKGPGIKALDELLNGTYVSPQGMGVGLMGSRKLVDDLNIESSSSGTTITVLKSVPQRINLLTQKELKELSERLMSRPADAFEEEVQKQSKELLLTISALNEKKEELDRLNRELEDTNRGVVALYAELDEKAESLRIANEAKTSFLSDMTHEFRSPLNSILSLTNILLEDARSDQAGEREKQIQFIIKAANGLSNLVNDLLDIAKIEAGKVNIRPESFSVSDIFSTLRGLMRPLESDLERLQLIFEDTEDQIELFTDEGKLAQILRNLISNAIKYTDKGEVVVRAQTVDQGFIEFSVSDTGIGIPEDHLEDIFFEFFQVEHSLQKRSKGTGLGLPLTKKLVTLLGGHISVTSVLGKGSSFKFIIPSHYSGPSDAQYKDVSTAQAKSLASLASSLTLPKILMVDDEEVNRYQVARALQGLKVEYREAYDGLDALQITESFDPDIIILDLAMPKMDGMTYLKECMKRGLYARRKIYLFTSQELEGEDLEYLAEVCEKIILKDKHGVEKLVEEVKKVIP